MKVDVADTFKKVYEKESDAIFRFCFVRVSDREQALDITQETFMRLWKSLLDGKDILNDRAFLFTIAHRLVIDWYRKKKSLSLDKMMNDEKEKKSSYDIADEKSLNTELGAEGRYLVKKIKELTPTYQDPVYLRFVEGMSPKDIGKILKISANAASVRINRGLEELREKTGYNKK
ncbi:MAG TPA: RNA polymerase sigma factor [Candidatus Paceibacterota bacterium]|nr:RNA polymerase sigma factor [Candidatus Paceibacterota bacterium]HPT18363.1 RNA polymerase sigma factor [Candidatus Paceibacterota bacterium]